MCMQDPEGFQHCEPGACKIIRGILHSLGPNHKWSADGHDKLVSLEFAIWRICDKWSGKWLSLWVVPNNHYKDSIAYLYLKLVVELGGRSSSDYYCLLLYLYPSLFLAGIPIQSTTNCGSETTLLYGFASAFQSVS